MRMTEQEVMDYAAENDVKFIRLAFVDLYGTLKNMAITPSELPRAFAGGFSFDPSAVKGFCDVAEGELFLQPDPSTLCVLPWRPQTGRVVRMLCDCYTQDGEPFAGYSRTILRQQVEKAARLGFRFRLGTQYEFYLFENDERGNMTLIPQDQAGYMDVSPLDKGENIRREICLDLESMHILPESSHHEQGPGQNEIDFQRADPLSTADNALAFKGAVRAIAAQYGLSASFLPKPLAEESGNGLHVNLSMARDGEQLFEEHEGGLHPLAQHAMAGILRRTREMSLLLNPLPSSYQRLGTVEAPSRISWSRGDRTHVMRVPAVKPGHGCVELRSPDPACNPYLAFTVILAAALEGIAQETPLPPVLTETGQLPRDLGEAIVLAEQSDFLRETLPQAMLKKYLAEKRRLWERFQGDPKTVFAQHLRAI